jgi:hypothetical protein
LRGPCPTHFSLLDFFILIMFNDDTRYEALYYAILSNIVSLSLSCPCPPAIYSDFFTKYDYVLNLIEKHILFFTFLDSR